MTKNNGIALNVVGKTKKQKGYKEQKFNFLMVYEFSIEKLAYIYTRMLPSLSSAISKDENKFQEVLFEEGAYFEACYFLKNNGIPGKWPEIKKAEDFYKKGETHNANCTIHEFWNEIDHLASITKKDIKYYGN